MKLLSFIFIASLALLAPAQTLRAIEQTPNQQDAAFVIQAYLRATYARDYIEAYRYISAEDRRTKDLNRYIQQRGAYFGFALEAARKLAEFIDIKPVTKPDSQNHIQVIAHIKAPDLNQISALLLDWNTYQLNSLPAPDRKKIIESIEKKHRDRSLEMREDEERLELVQENNEWRIFLNWAAGIKIPLRLLLSATPELEVTLSRSEAVVQPGEVFEVFLTIKNRSSRPMIARIGHLVEPQPVADYLDFVECGFLLPVTLQPGEQQYSGRYVLRSSIPEGVRQLSVTYDFRPLK